MERKDIKVGAIVKNTKHGNLEQVLSFGRSRMADGSWVDAVCYEGYDRFTGQLMQFYREVNSFCEDFELVSLPDERQAYALSMQEYQTRAIGTCMDSSNNFAYMFYNLLGEVGELTEKVNDYMRDQSLEDMANKLCGYGLMAKAIRKEPDSWASLNVVSDFDKHLEEFKGSVLLQKELGDIQWQLSGVCTVLSLALEDIARQNLEKLASRQERNKIDGDGDNR